MFPELLREMILSPGWLRKITSGEWSIPAVSCIRIWAGLERSGKKIQAGYIEASRERKVFEKLKEKKAAEFYREERKNEILKQDDLNSSAAARRIEAGGKE